MRWMLIPMLLAISAGPAAAQGFAPSQSRAAEPPPRAARVAATNTRPGGLAGLETSVLSNGAPVPVPLGMAEPGSTNGVLSARVPTFGALVTLPPSFVANGGRLYTYTNANGGLESVAYDPTTGATVVYDQSTSYSLQDRAAQFGYGFGDVPRVGSYSGAGIAGNPSFSLQPGQAISSSGIPLLNQATPSYDYRTNLGLGPAPIPSPPSPFAGTPLGTLGGGIGPQGSPSFGTPSASFGLAPTPDLGNVAPLVGGTP